MAGNSIKSTTRMKPSQKILFITGTDKSVRPREALSNENYFLSLRFTIQLISAEVDALASVYSDTVYLLLLIRCQSGLFF